MQALNDDIGSLMDGTVREVRRKPQMRSMCFIHHQRDAMSMTDFSDLSNVGNDTVKGRRNRYHQFDIRVF